MLGESYTVYFGSPYPIVSVGWTCSLHIVLRAWYTIKRKSAYWVQRTSKVTRFRRNARETVPHFTKTVPEVLNGQAV